MLRTVRTLVLLTLGAIVFIGECLAQPNRPNILWITSEDNGNELGCYGDQFATSPNIDALAARGIRFRHCWSNAPVCAPARTTIISGMYATSLGASNMRSRATRPHGTMLLPELLRAHDYYCSNNSKEDYNFVSAGKPWDDSSTKGHWRNRPEGKPFFSVFNFTISHESQIRTRPHTPKHDPALVPLPPYHPDLPEIRQDWAQYYDKVEAMDSQVGAILQQLREDNLEDSTIIFYFGDHGSGMPRSKRWLYQGGLQVPMLVVIPEAFKHLRNDDYEAGGVNDRLISFVDLVPTILKLTDAPIPSYLQGTPFLGSGELTPSTHLFGFRDRMDERIDMSRAIRNERYLYIRNFMPYRPQGVYLNYMFQTPTTRVWREAYRSGSLPSEQSAFWEPKPIEELYDLESDPYNIRNLAADPQLASMKEKLRRELQRVMIDTKDLGVIPESIVKAERVEPDWDWTEMVNAAFFDLSKPLDDDQLRHTNPVLRYWLAQSLLAAVLDPAIPVNKNVLSPASKLQNDTETSVQIVAQEVIASAGNESQREAAIAGLKRIANLETHGLLNAVAALNSLANLEVEFPEVVSLPSKDETLEPVYHDYMDRLKDYISRKEH
ncbi:sulfatase family protein [Pirellulaceae bacterium SH449]